MSGRRRHEFPMRGGLPQRPGRRYPRLHRRYDNDRSQRRQRAKRDELTEARRRAFENEALPRASSPSISRRENPSPNSFRIEVEVAPTVREPSRLRTVGGVPVTTVPAVRMRRCLLPVVVLVRDSVRLVVARGPMIVIVRAPSGAWQTTLQNSRFRRSDSTGSQISRLWAPAFTLDLDTQ